MKGIVSLSTLLNICLMIIMAYAIVQLKPLRWMFHESEASLNQRQLWLRKVVLGITMGLFCVISNTVGHMVEGSIPNSRVIGAMAAGLIGGPVSGMIASGIGAFHRYLIEPTRISTTACVVATLLQGVMGSVAWYANGKKIRYSRWFLLLYTGIAEIMHMALIYGMIATKGAAIEILNKIAFPMIIGNSIGMVIVFTILWDVLLQDDRDEALMVEKSLQMATRCIPYLRVNSSKEEEEDDVRQVMQLIMADGIYMGIAILKNRRFLGRTPEFEGLPELLPEYPEVMRAALADSHAILAKECPKGDILAPIYERYQVVCIALDMAPGHENLMVALLPKNRMASNLGVSYMESLGRFFSTFYKANQVDLQRELLKKAELQALQSQINPHFLFNALNTISYFTREKPDKARELILALSRYFRNTLQEAESMVPLAKELDHVRSYLMLEEARFEERLTVRIDADEEALEIPVPNLILQPLVENAIRHGAMTRKRGVVEIQIHPEEEPKGVRIRILDNGPGLSEAAAQSLVTGYGENQGIGMLNVHRRLMGIWGQEAGLRYSRENEWTCLETVIPLPE